MLKSIDKRRFTGKVLSTVLCAVLCAVLMMAFVPMLAGNGYANGASYDKAADVKYHVSDGVEHNDKSANIIAKKDSDKNSEKDSDKENAVEPEQPQKSTDSSAQEPSKEPSGDAAKEPVKATSSFNKGFLMLAIAGAVILIAIVALLIRRSNKKAAKEIDF